MTELTDKDSECSCSPKLNWSLISCIYANVVGLHRQTVRSCWSPSESLQIKFIYIHDDHNNIATHASPSVLSPSTGPRFFVVSETVCLHPRASMRD